MIISRCGQSYKIAQQNPQPIDQIIGALSYAIQHVNMSDWELAQKAVDKASDLIQDQMMPEAPEDLDFYENTPDLMDTHPSAGYMGGYGEGEY